MQEEKRKSRVGAAIEYVGILNEAQGRIQDTKPDSPIESVQRQLSNMQEESMKLRATIDELESELLRVYRRLDRQY